MEKALMNKAAPGYRRRGYMKSKVLSYLCVLVLLLSALPACQGGGGGYTAPPAAPATPGYGITPGMQQIFGMMSNNMGQMHRMMGQGYMGSEHYSQVMGMMGQMGGMMQGMGGPYYSPEMEQRHRQQLEQMHQKLSSMEGQGKIRAASGAQIFATGCAACHPNGGNVITPNLPLRGSPPLRSFETFRTFVREGHGAMPAFSPAQISESQMRPLYQYVLSAW
jgi:cytochrome c6